MITFRLAQHPISHRRVACVLGLAVATCASVLPLKWAVPLVLGAPGVIALAVRPEWVVLALPLLVPFTYQFSLTVGGFRLGLLDLALIAVTALWLARSVARRRLELRVDGLGVLLLLWLWIILLSLLGSRSLSAGLSESFKWGEVILVYLVARVLIGKNELRLVVFSITIAGVVSALLGLFQFISGHGPEGFVLFGRFMRAYGTFEQPNPFAGHLGLSLPFALAWVVAGSDRPRWERLLMLAAAAVMGLGILASWSRGSWLALAIATALMLALLAPRLSLLATSLVLLVMLVMGGNVVESPLARRVLGMGSDVRTLNVAQVEPTDENWSVVERLAHWQAGWYMFAARPWLGVGIGNYEVVYPQYALPRWSDPLGHAHNYYLNVAAETGLIGLCAYGALGGAIALKTLSAWRHAKDSRARALILAALGSLTYLGVHNLVDNLYVHGMQFLVALSLVGVAVASASEGSEMKEASIA
ncbi:MAG: O-antigen ligase family protein [Anaerolineae bacterium]